MTRTFTNQDLVRYLYDELPNSEREAMECAQLTDVEIEHVTEELEDTKAVLDGFMLKAPQDAVENILAYSKTLR